MKFDSLLNQLMQQIQAATGRVDVTEIARLSQLAHRVQGIKNQASALEQELLQIQAAIEGKSAPEEKPDDWAHDPVIPGFIRRPISSVNVQINWQRCGINRPIAKINEAKMSANLVRFVTEIKDALGIEALKKLTAFKISRGPPLSQNPNSDYVNKTNGSIYSHHLVPGTTYYVLTHSSTHEKRDAIRGAWYFLGLPEDALSVQ